MNMGGKVMNMAGKFINMGGKFINIEGKSFGHAQRNAQGTARSTTSVFSVPSVVQSQAEPPSKRREHEHDNEEGGHGKKRERSDAFGRLAREMLLTARVAHAR
jgi:hypothetical protein